MNPIVKVILQVLGGAIAFALVCVVGIWAFTNYPTIAWIVFIVLLVGAAGTITGVFPAIYRAITGK